MRRARRSRLYWRRRSNVPDVIAVNKIDQALKTRSRPSRTCSALMPDAKVLRTEYGRAPLGIVAGEVHCER